MTSYRAIVLDPPWPYENLSGRQAAPYRLMTIDDIIGFGVEHIPRWAHSEGCHLYLWATDPYVGCANELVRAWGGRPTAWLVWIKDRIGMGNYYRHQHELCLFSVMGRLPVQRRDMPTIFRAAVTRHSEKPDAFYSLVEQVSPGPRLDVFARQRRAGWDAFGNEVEAIYQLRLDGNNVTQILPGDEHSRGS